MLQNLKICREQQKELEIIKEPEKELEVISQTINNNIYNINLMKKN